MCKDEETKSVEPINDDLIAGLSVEELENRLEMQVLGIGIPVVVPNGRYTSITAVF